VTKYENNFKLRWPIASPVSSRLMVIVIICTQSGEDAEDEFDAIGDVLTHEDVAQMGSHGGDAHAQDHCNLLVAFTGED